MNNETESLGYQRELREYIKEKKKQETILNAEQLKIATMLKGNMGKDMLEVLEGKKTVKLSFKEKMKYKLKKIRDFFLDIIDIVFEVI